MKVLVTGATGLLGGEVVDVLKSRNIECRGIGSKDLDITQEGKVHKYIKAYRPDAVIHCAAYTDADKAESEPEKCRAVNALGTAYIAEACREIDTKMVYISTDYVFGDDGDRPHEVDDPVYPLNVYGQTKWEGEEAVRRILRKYFIVRISWVFGEHGNNFVKTMLRLGQTHKEISVVADQFGAPTYTADLAPLLCDMVQTEKIRHLSRLQQRLLLLGGTGRRDLSPGAHGCESKAHRDRRVSHESTTAEKFKAGYGDFER